MTDPKSQLYRIWAGRVELVGRSWLSSRALLSVGGSVEAEPSIYHV